jgi:hypothetical protein
MMPGGFPPAHPRFWANRVAPVAVLTVVALAVATARRRRFDLLRPILLAFPAAWAGAALAARVVFPISFARLLALPLFGAVLMVVVAFLTFRRGATAPSWPMWVVAAVAALIGAGLPLTQCAPDPDTRPLDAPMPEAVVGALGEMAVGISVPGIRVHPGDASPTVRAGTLGLAVHPVLRFLSRSPDGCWTILAPPRLRDGPDLVLRSDLREGDRLAFRYRADYEAMLSVAPDPEGRTVLLEAMARLPRPVFSHLNSFCDLEVWGHRRLALSFSPCPGTLIEVRPADYPAGRPLRLAYLDARGGFHVVEATSGEKGPFRELAVGRLARSEPLAITLHDRGVAQARVVLEDWSAQAGTSPSPTAGWGVPVNAIEFRLEGEEPGSSAGIYLTLAGTSVGRGWDSVGHGAGTYRNRMRIEVLGVAGPPGRALRHNPPQATGNGKVHVDPPGNLPAGEIPGIGPVQAQPLLGGSLPGASRHSLLGEGTCRGRSSLSGCSTRRRFGVIDLARPGIGIGLEDLAEGERVPLAPVEEWETVAPAAFLDARHPRCPLVQGNATAT